MCNICQEKLAKNSSKGKRADDTRDHEEVSYYFPNLLQKTHYVTEYDLRVLHLTILVNFSEDYQLILPIIINEM